MTSTPDEIKKGMECCITDKCKECPYYPLYEVFGCKLARAKDALALIQQLQAENAEKDARIQQLEAELSDAKNNHQHTIDIAERQKGQIDKLKKVIVRLNAERDAAVEDLHYLVNHPQSAGPCYACKHTDECYSGGDCDPVENDRWEWRGVQKD